MKLGIDFLSHSFFFPLPHLNAVDLGFWFWELENLGIELLHILVIAHPLEENLKLCEKAINGEFQMIDIVLVHDTKFQVWSLIEIEPGEYIEFNEFLGHIQNQGTAFTFVHERTQYPGYIIETSQRDRFAEKKGESEVLDQDVHLLPGQEPLLFPQEIRQNDSIRNNFQNAVVYLDCKVFVPVEYFFSGLTRLVHLGRSCSLQFKFPTSL